MKRSLASALFAGLTVLASAQVVDPALAQSSGGPYGMDSVVITAGGGTLGGGAFQLRGSFGQATTSTLSSSGYRIYDGLWGPDDDIFHNSFEYH
ncbi:MAG: hypothetical protein P4L92_01775 [Rudaea sp.]|nr:hypothetical protein [Rudaea sp.]